MATSSIQTVTDGTPWRYYIRQKSDRWVLGIIDKNGDAITVASINIKMSYTGIPADATDEGETLPIPKDAELDFCKGIAYEVLLGKGIVHREFKLGFKDAIKKLIKRKVFNVNTPSMVSPVKIIP